MFQPGLSYPPTALSETELSSLLTKWRFYEKGRVPDLEVFVGEQGERLSGGQMQKLELARVTGVNIPVVVLDESTSALDIPSEGAAVDNLRAHLCRRATVVMISHRIRVVEMAEKVLFLVEGRLAAYGRHDVLLAELPDYANFWAIEE